MINSLKLAGTICSVPTHIQTTKAVKFSIRVGGSIFTAIHFISENEQIDVYKYDEVLIVGRLQQRRDTGAIEIVATHLKRLDASIFNDVNGG